eukprot:6013766-Ditylum_brightwellii.AAC.1
MGSSSLHEETRQLCQTPDDTFASIDFAFKVAAFDLKICNKEWQLVDALSLARSGLRFLQIIAPAVYNSHGQL